MALLLDEAHWHWRGRMWCHLVSDHSLDELHAFAEWIGVPRRAFQGDHYDIPEEARPVAIEEGALVVTSREIVLALYAAGMRHRPADRRPSPARERRESPAHHHSPAFTLERVAPAPGFPSNRLPFRG